jgi:DNA primase catalytic subunit
MNPIGMVRNLSFSSIEKLRSYLIEYQPSHVFYSASKYERPWQIRDKTKGETILMAKGWIESDLIFDIDNNHLHTPTIAEAAYQANKLYWILQNKFALKKLIMKFSGSRGYHVHAEDDCIQKLGQYDRQEIADYFMEFMPQRNKYGNKVYNKNYVCLDVPITTTLSHLIRLPGSIHGKTMQECRILDIGN